ncbi:MAG TPA: RNA methyltransferase [Candidatus Binatia bacterium]|nr:RNA methyltransferase [Candidatus Binatia bacterium]
MSLLDRVRIVLVRPQHPGNIGAAARAMKTMGLADLVLVAPRAFPDPQADAMAVDAKDLLASARVVEDLPAAVADCALVAGSSARLRSLPHNTWAPREWAARMAGQTGGRIAIVFGPERIGLTNEEMHLCHELVSIPANPAYSALNVAAAVQVLAYEVRVAAGEGALPVPEREPVAHAEMERLYQHLERLMVRVEFLDPRHPKQLLPRLRRLFGRAAPDANEMNILRGFLAHVEARLPPREPGS